MTPLVIVIGVVLVITVAVNLVGRARAGRRSVRSHHRALDTLGHISTQHGEDDPRRATPVLPVPRSSRQAHVRVVSADTESLPAPKPLTGGWRPTRATGAAPFRRPPTARHDLWDDPASEPQSSDAVSPATVSAPSATDQVRIVAHVEDPIDDTEDPVTAEGPVVTPRNRLMDPWPDAVGTRADDGGGPGLLAFDDTSTASDQPTAAVPAHRPLGVPAGARALTPPRPARTDLAALASVPAARSARSHQRRPVRRDGGRNRALGGAAIVLLVAVIAVGAVVALGGHTHHSPTAARVVHHRRRHKKAVTVTPPSTTPTTTAPAFHLVSSSPGASVYEVSGTQPISVKANGPCWIEIRHGSSTGALVYSETMPAGAVETVSGPVWVRLGNPTAVSVTVGGRTVSAPVTSGQPYDLQFE